MSEKDFRPSPPARTSGLRTGSDCLPPGRVPSTHGRPTRTRLWWLLAAAALPWLAIALTVLAEVLP